MFISGEDAIPPQYGKVFVAIKPLSGTKLSDSEKDSVARSVLQEKNIVSIIPEIIDPEYVYLKFKTNVIFDPARTGAGSEGIKTLVKDKLLSFVDRRLERFGEHLYYSRLLSEIDNLDDSIVGNETSIKMQKWLEPILGFPGGYTINFYNPIFNPHTGHAVASIESTMFKYRDADGIIRDANIEDDGAGKLIIVRKTSGQKIKMFEIGTVNYSTGSLELVSFNPVTDDTSSLIKFTATPRDQNIMSSRNIILTIDSADSTTTDVSIEIAGRRTLDTTENHSPSYHYYVSYRPLKQLRHLHPQHQVVSPIPQVVEVVVQIHPVPVMAEAEEAAVVDTVVIKEINPC